jgi:hypothetical protein
MSLRCDANRPYRKDALMAEPKTGTIAVPGAELYYDVRGSDSSAHPALLIIGSPMGAAGFATLAGHFADRTVLPRRPRRVPWRRIRPYGQARRLRGHRARCAGRHLVSVYGCGSDG